MSRFGIWIRMEHWACENGGDDLFGTKEEMEAKLVEWKAENAANGNPDPPDIVYEVREIKT
jgi:hypothetical protein